MNESYVEETEVVEDEEEVGNEETSFKKKKKKKGAIRSLLELGRQKGASDLHLAEGVPPIFRINGELVKMLDTPPLTRDKVYNMINAILTEEQRRIVKEELQLDSALELEDGRYRVSVYTTRKGLSASLRLIPDKIKSFKELGLPESLEKLMQLSDGLILVTGPTGCGKSTTLASMIDWINEHRQEHIITVEDPIEFVHQHKRCMINQREIGAHTESFASALRSALRQDPDIILIGEMRDLETISTALTAAETGHLVLATLHTKSAAKAIDRLIDAFPAHQQNQVRIQLSETMQAIIAQSLLPLKEGNGRVPAVEILVATPAVRNTIREMKTHQIPSIIQTSGRDGMQSLAQSLRSLLHEDKISKAEMLKRFTDKEIFALAGGYYQEE